MSNKKYFWEGILAAMVMGLIIGMSVSLLVLFIKALVYLIGVIW